MNMFKKELYDAYLGSMGRKQVIKVKGESGTEYRIVLEPNALPYCSCPSYEYQSFSEIKVLQAVNMKSPLYRIQAHCSKW